MNIYGTCKECGTEFELKTHEIEDCIYECPACGHPHTLGEFLYLDDKHSPAIPIPIQPVKTSEADLAEALLLIAFPHNHIMIPKSAKLGLAVVQPSMISEYKPIIDYKFCFEHKP